MSDIKSNAAFQPRLSWLCRFQRGCNRGGKRYQNRPGAATGAAACRCGRCLERRTGKLQPLATGDPRIKLVRHEVNQGKGAALRTGFALATAPIVIVQDADLEYDPGAYFTGCSRRILSGKVVRVFGSRFYRLRRAPGFVFLVRSVMLTTLSNMATGVNLTDMETCYKTFRRREIIQKIKIEENRFGFEPEITAKVVL